MDLSIFLAKLFGLYFLIISLLLLMIRQERMLETTKALVKQPELIFFMSIINLGVGLALIIGHNIWILDWRVIITLLGWLILIRGIINIYSPTFAAKSIKIIENKPLYYFILVIYLVIGVYLTYVGFYTSGG